jgi:transcriptional regulator GlxA family with amidase domain
MIVSGKLLVENGERPDRMLVLQLLGEALTLLECDRIAARRRVEDALALLNAFPEAQRPKRRMLADWQVRRAEEFVHAKLGGCLRIEDVARAVKLSTSYFSRAFKRSVGVSYSEYVIKARLDLAKRLLLTSQSPIAEIAVACGLADQSHLTRLFSRSEGLPPRAWVRMVRDRGFSSPSLDPDAVAEIRSAKAEESLSFRQQRNSTQHRGSLRAERSGA